MKFIPKFRLPVQLKLASKVLPGSSLKPDVFKSVLFTLPLMVALAFSALSVAAPKSEAMNKTLAEMSAPVNVNKADAQTLADSMKGVGLKKAQAIVAWRNANGDFKNLEDMLQVKGIGEKTLSKNRGRLVVK